MEEQTGSMDPKTNFKLIVVKTELERFKFLVRSFLRARLKKVRSRSSRCWSSIHWRLKWSADDGFID